MDEVDCAPPADGSISSNGGGTDVSVEAGDPAPTGGGTRGWVNEKGCIGSGHGRIDLVGLQAKRRTLMCVAGRLEPYNMVTKIPLGIFGSKYVTTKIAFECGRVPWGSKTASIRACIHKNLSS